MASEGDWVERKVQVKNKNKTQPLKSATYSSSCRERETSDGSKEVATSTHLKKRSRSSTDQMNIATKSLEEKTFKNSFGTQFFWS